MSTNITAPFPLFVGLDGLPLEDGYVYIGLENQNPETAPKNVYWDSALSASALQPLRTLNGYIARSGSATNVFVSGNFSITVRDRRNRLVASLPSVQDFPSLISSSAGASVVGFKADGENATSRTVQAKLREFVSVFDFGAVGDSLEDDTAAIQKAVDYAVANNRAVLINSGEFKITSPISIAGKVSVYGEGQGLSRLLCVGCNAFTISAGVSLVSISDITIAHSSRYTISPNSNTAINILGTTASQCYWHTYKDLFIDGFEVGFYASGACSSRWHNVTTVYTHQSMTFVAQCLNNSISQCNFGEEFDSAAGSYGIKVGDGAINCEGLQISDSLIYGVSRGIWVNASINVVAHHNIIDMVREFGILAQGNSSVGCINNIFSANYIGMTGSSGDTGVYLVNACATTDSQNRGTIVRDNEILAYPGSSMSYGILVDGAEEERNLISGNRVQNSTAFDCLIAAGSGHRVSDNLWRSSNGFRNSVPGVSYINNTGNIYDQYPSPIGVFTPVAIGTSSPGTGSYTVQNGTYKIVDNVVEFSLRLSWNAHSGTGELRISGLPVASKNVAGYTPAVTVNVENMTYPAGASSIIGIVNTNATTIELRGAGNALAPVPVAMDTSANVYISGFYEIA